MPGQSDAEIGKSLKYKRDFCKEAKPEPGSGFVSDSSREPEPGSGFVFGSSREPELGSGFLNSLGAKLKLNSDFQFVTDFHFYFIKYDCIHIMTFVAVSAVHF